MDRVISAVRNTAMRVKRKLMEEKNKEEVKPIKIFCKAEAGEYYPDTGQVILNEAVDPKFIVESLMTDNIALAKEIEKLKEEILNLTKQIPKEEGDI